MTGPGIFCVEGGWSSRLHDENSVLPVLHFLKGVGKIDYIHRYVETRDGLFSLLHRWPQKQYERWSLGYLGFHGDPGCIYLHRDTISLEEIAEALAGRCVGKVIYFGSCGVMRVSDARLEGS